MNKRKLMCGVFSMIFTGFFSVFIVSVAFSNVTQGIVIRKYRPANPSSEFVSSSFSASDENFSLPSFSLSKEKGEFSKQSSISQESSFSSKSSSKPKSDSGEFSETSFSIHDDAEFSSSPSLSPNRK